MKEALAIFARYPRLGRVKTRLASKLGRESALELYTAFLLDTVERTGDLAVQRFLFLADCIEGEAEELALSSHFPASLGVRLQQGRDLGDRLWNAYESLAAEHSKVVFVGTDTPSLPMVHIRSAFAALAEVPFALGPVEDGGYYLLGAAQPRRNLFYDIPWGSDRVLTETLSRLQPEEFKLLPSWYDIDTVADLTRLRMDLTQEFPGSPSRTRKALLRLRVD